MGHRQTLNLVELIASPGGCRHFLDGTDRYLIVGQMTKSCSSLECGMKEGRRPALQTTPKPAQVLHLGIFLEFIPFCIGICPFFPSKCLRYSSFCRGATSGFSTRSLQSISGPSGNRSAMFRYLQLVCLLVVTVIWTGESLPVEPSSLSFLAKYASVKQLNRRVSDSVSEFLSKSKFVRKESSTTTASTAASTTTTTAPTEPPPDQFRTDEVTIPSDTESAEVTTAKPPINCTDWGIIGSLLRMHLSDVEFTYLDDFEVLISVNVDPNPPRVISLDPFKKFSRIPVPSSYPTPPMAPFSDSVSTLRTLLQSFGVPGGLIDRVRPQLDQERINLSQDNNIYTINDNYLRYSDSFKKRSPLPSRKVGSLKSVMTPPSPRSLKNESNDSSSWIHHLKRKLLEKSLINTENFCPSSSASYWPLDAKNGQRVSEALKHIRFEY